MKLCNLSKLWGMDIIIGVCFFLCFAGFVPCYAQTGELISDTELKADVEDEVIGGTVEEGNDFEEEVEKPKDIFDLIVPSSFGRIKEIYKGSSKEVIIHIQDAHNNYEAQDNISNIVDLLVEKYGVRVAGIEGASKGKLNTAIFSTFPHDEIRAQTAEFFVREGKMSGPEALVIAKGYEYPLQLYGIEDRELYDNNMEAFKTSLPFKDEAKKYFADLNSGLTQIKYQLYFPELSEFDRKQKFFEDGRMTLNDYCLFLAQHSEDKKISLENFSNLSGLLKAIDLESRLDFNKAEEERTKLLTELTNVLPEEDISKLLDKGLSYKNEEMSVSRYLLFVKELANKNEINFNQYKDLDRYIDYATNYDLINSADLFGEIGDIEDAIRNKLHVNSRQKEIDILIKGLKVMERLIDIKMVNRDLEFYQRNQEDIKADRYIEFIKKEADRYGLSIEMPQDISYLDVYIPAWVDFYRQAGLRDKAMVDNTLLMIKENDQKLGIIVTGGFHTRELVRIMKERSLSFIVITPRITENIPGPYFDRLLGKKTDLDRFLEEPDVGPPVKNIAE